MLTDAELLHRYVQEQAEDAFAELVRRYLNLVYSAALRRTGGRHSLAEEISQKVFCDLAGKAAQLLRHPALTAWLYRSTRYATIDAVRAELRREKLTNSFAATMHEDSYSPESQVDWDHLRPVIDQAMDQLKECDRELMLLRFFKGLTFAEVGEKLHLNENAARMRTERALQKLRFYLSKRGVTSTAGVIAGLLTNQSLVAAPVSLSATITAAALAVTPASAATGIVSLVFMSKLTAPIISATIAAGLTFVVWTSQAHDVNAGELAALRLEHNRLVEASAAGGAASAVKIADEFAAQANAIAQVLGRKQRVNSRSLPANTLTSANVVSATPSAPNHNGHSYHGCSTARDTFLSFAWADDAADIHSLSKLISFDGRSREKIVTMLAGMPESIRTQYPTPEEFFAFLLAADSLLGPPPGADVIEHYVPVELRPGRVAFCKPGTRRGGTEYQETPDGWKFALPEAFVDALPPTILSNETLSKLNSL